MRDFFVSSHVKVQRLFDYAVCDRFYAPIIHDLVNYGHGIQFSALGGQGAYSPQGLRTERLDDRRKIKQFYNGLAKVFSQSDVRVKMRFSLWAGFDDVSHRFLHEVMHFYQDMNGLYFTPIEEEGVFPVIMDAKSHVSCILFNEAWAQIEAIRSSYALKMKGFDIGWRGACKHPNFAYIARGYEARLEAGEIESQVAAHIFKAWFNGKHRMAYERQALKIYNMNLQRYTEQAPFNSDYLRALNLSEMLSGVEQPTFWSSLDFNDDTYTPRLDLTHYEQAKSFEIGDIKRGSLVYLWNQMRKRSIVH